MTLDFNKLIESARELLNIAVKSELRIKTSDGTLITKDNLEQILGCYKEETSSDLIDFVNNVISDISLITGTRAEFLLRDGNCKMIDSCEEGYGPNYTVPLRKVVDKLHGLCTSGWNTFKLPNGNTYTPRNLSESTKLMVRCYLTDEANRFTSEYKNKPENYEKLLEAHLNDYMMDCEYQNMKNDIEAWESTAKNYELLVDGVNLDVLKSQACSLLLKAMSLNINIIVDDKRLNDEKDVKTIIDCYEDSDAQELIHLVKTVIETICQWKTSLQKLIENDFNKSEINITTIDFDVDDNDVFSDKELQQCYLTGELYSASGANDADIEKKINNILGELDKFKPKFIASSKSMCRVRGVKYSEEEFEKAFNSAKAFVKKECIQKERNWMNGISFNLMPDIFVKTFINQYRKAYSVWVSKAINSSIAE